MNIWFVIEVMLAFSFMIAIHEWGHYIMMRLCGVKVERFAIGFGPTIVAKKWGDTEFALLAIPLGGYCKPAGGDMSDTSTEKMNEKPPAPGEFLYASWWKRTLIALAGPGMNLFSAFAIILGLLLVMGEPVSNEKAILGFVPPGSLAAQAGLKTGDLILSENGKEIKSFDDLLDGLPDYGKASALTVQRGKKTLSMNLNRPVKPASADAEVPWGIADVMPAVVGDAVLGQPARNSGIQAGDVILAVNGKKPRDWSEVAYLIRNSKNDPLEFEIQRGAQPHTIAIRRIFNGEYMAIGIAPVEDKSVVFKKVSLLAATKDAYGFTISRCELMLSGIAKLVTAKVSLKDSVSGPITIMRMMYSQAAQKAQDFFTLISVISLMLCIMNLLPIPVVDGGQIVLFLIEGIKRSPVSLKLQIIYQQVGFVMILGLMALAVFNDLKNIFLEIHNHIR